VKLRIQIAILAALCLIVSADSASQSSDSSGNIYAFTTPSRDGIGKHYFGREISQVMGHRGAVWLERRSRVAEEHPDDVAKAMALATDAKVADIGAGTGYFSLWIAPEVPDGRVYAVDIQPEMLAILRERIERQAIKELEAVGLQWLETKDFLPTQHFMVFEKPAPIR
jgi:SAM-dependent methyltransferase